MALAAWRVVIAALFLVIPGVALAADIDSSSPPPPVTAKSALVAPDWVVTIGAEVRAIPAWPGSPTNLYGYTGFPLLALQKPTDPPFFFGARDGFGVPILDFGQLQFGPVGKIEFPRYNGQYRQLNGMGEIPWALQLGAYAIYWPVPWLRLRGEIRQGIGGETGQTADVFADVVVPVGQFRLSGGPRFEAQSTAAVSPYFSVSAGQSAATGLPVYAATGGFYSYGAGGQIEYFFDRQWSVHAIAEYERINGSAADSPLVTMRGSPNQLTFGVGATYTFNMRPLW
jgi:outer membrane protein